jgi:hypothetical protein
MNSLLSSGIGSGCAQPGQGSPVRCVVRTADSLSVAPITRRDGPSCCTHQRASTLSTPTVSTGVSGKDLLPSLRVEKRLDTADLDTAAARRGEHVDLQFSLVTGAQLTVAIQVREVAALTLDDTHLALRLWKPEDRLKESIRDRTTAHRGDRPEPQTLGREPWKDRTQVDPSGRACRGARPRCAGTACHRGDSRKGRFKGDRCSCRPGGHGTEWRVVANGSAATRGREPERAGDTGCTDALRQGAAPAWTRTRRSRLPGRSIGRHSDRQRR